MNSVSKPANKPMVHRGISPHGSPTLHRGMIASGNARKGKKKGGCGCK